MAVTPYIFAAGDIGTAARFNTRSTALTELQNPPGFQAVQNATQSIANNTNVAVIFQSELRDSDNGYNPATGIYTVATAGLWLFTANLGWTSNVTGLRQVTMFAGTFQSAMEVLASTDAIGRCIATVIAPMSIGDTVNVLGLQTSGGALTTFGTQARCSFGGYRIGP